MCGKQVDFYLLVIRKLLNIKSIIGPNGLNYFEAQGLFVSQYRPLFISVISTILKSNFLYERGFVETVKAK